MIETLLDPSQVIGRGYDVETLTFCLEFAIYNDPNGCFCHFKIEPGMDRSIRIFGRHPFKESISLPQPFAPQELAIMLVQYIDPPTWALDERARYPILIVDPDADAVVKGWTISRCVDVTDENGDPLIAAYAAWVKP